jgi:phosphatidylserine decarboxylase
LPQVTEWHYEPGQVSLIQGDELGRFLLGSTVVMLFPKDTLQFTPQWTPAKAIVLGEAMGSTAV